MGRTARSLLTEALALPEDERLQLASELIASIDGSADAEWEEAWLAELDRRIEAARTRSEPAAEWVTVRTRVLERLDSR